MKNNVKKIICIGIILVLMIVGVVIVLKGFAEDTTNIQTVEKSSGIINDIILPNDVKLTNGTIQYNNGVYYIEMNAHNNTKAEIDMRNYRLSLRDVNNYEIEYFSGDVIGILNSGESRTFIIESYADLSNIDTIIYEVFAGE